MKKYSLVLDLMDIDVHVADLQTLQRRVFDYEADKMIALIVAKMDNEKMLSIEEYTFMKNYLELAKEGPYSEKLITLVDNYAKKLIPESHMDIKNATFEQLKDYVLLIIAERRIEIIKKDIIAGKRIDEENAKKLDSLFNPFYVAEQIHQHTDHDANKTGTCK